MKKSTRRLLTEWAVGLLIITQALLAYSTIVLLKDVEQMRTFMLINRIEAFDA